MKKLLFFGAMIGIASHAYCQADLLRIDMGKTDTVAVAKQTIVGVTLAGAVATVNGQKVYVYPTGSFGTIVDLQPGANTIDIAVTTANGETAREQFVIVRDETYKRATGTKHEPVERDVATPFYVATTEGAYLQYGNGTDRLGASKMGFLDVDIPLKVVGERGDLYRVRLSDNHTAYIPKEYTSPTDIPADGVVNTSSWSITNQGSFDRVAISLPRRCAYRYNTHIDPSTIEIDIYGARDNSNWVTQRTLDLGMIDFIEYDQPEGDMYRATIRLKDKYQWGFSTHYEGNTLMIDVRHAPKNITVPGLTIGLDAGHGGEYPGAYSPGGLKEKDVNLDLVLRLADLLRNAGAKVVLTRDGDTGPTMAERKRIWKEANVDMAISIHNNWTPNPLSSPGTSTYYKHQFDRPLAQAVLTRILETGVPMFGLVGNFNFSLNAPTDYPNILIEGLFMNSLEEEAKLADPEFRALFAKKVYLGIEDYLKDVRKSKGLKK